MQLSLSNICFHYNKKQNILEGINFDLTEGQALGLLGHNGSGKSTLLKVISGLRKPQEGTYQINGEDVHAIKSASLYQKMGVMIESPGLYGHLTVLDNLKIFASYHRAPLADALSFLERVGMQSHEHKQVRKLSTGMKQRVAITIALMGNPELLLLDEPSSGLDPEGIANIRSLLKELKEEGKTLIISSHQLSEVEKICDEILILQNGHQLYHGSVNPGQYRDLEEMYLALNKQTDHV